MTRHRARLLAVVLVASLFASVTGFARVQFLCRMSGEVGRACCCSEHEEKAEAGVLQIRPADCCEAVLGKAADRTVTEPPSGIRVPPQVVATVPASSGMREAPQVVFEGRAAERSRGPPSQGPPLYIKHCTLLA